MDDTLSRHRQRRNNPPLARKRRNSTKTNTFRDKTVRQILAAIVILAALAAVKGIDSPVTNFLSDKVSTVLSQNIDVNGIYDSIGRNFTRVPGE